GEFRTSDHLNLTFEWLNLKAYIVSYPMRLLLSVLLVFGTSSAYAAVISGPVAFGGSNYYLLSKNSWTGAESEAVSLGGTLVTVNSASENSFLVNSFVLGGHNGDPMWIGLTDQAVEGTFVWASGQPVTYTNWASGEPNDAGGNEDYATINW